MPTSEGLSNHTYGRDLGFKPHVHLAMTKGGLKNGKAVRLQAPLFDLEPMVQSFQHLDWRERIKASFGYDPLECPHCGCIMQLAEIWEPKRGHIWMKRWIDAHRMHKTARLAMERLRLEAHS